MKHLKIMIAMVAIAVGSFAVMSFTSGHFKKNAFTQECFYYVGDNANGITTIGNWDTAPLITDQNPGICTMPNVICAACFNSTDYASGLATSVGSETLAQYIHDYVVANSPIEGTVIHPLSGKAVTLYFKDSYNTLP